MRPDASNVAAPSRMRLDHVDGLRALAALIVYVNHAYAQVWNLKLVPPPSLAFARWSLVAGHLSVTVFIVLSGFCLTLPVLAQGGELRGGVSGFLKRRARRILPPYYAALAISLLLIWTVIGEPTGTLWDVPLLVTPTSILVHLALLQDLFATGHINYVFWSIAVEWQIYFAVPLLVLAWRRYGAWKVVLGALVIGYALRFGFSETRLVRAHPQFLGMFALGMLAAYVARSPEPHFVKLRDAVPWTLLTGFALAFALALAAFWGIDVSHERFHWLDLPVGAMTLCCLIATSKPLESRLTRVLSFRPLVIIGTFSYSLYLIHAPLLQIMWQYALHPLGLGDAAIFSYLMTLGLVAVLCVSYGFHRLFEFPFMRSPKPAASSTPTPIMAP